MAAQHVLQFQWLVTAVYTLFDNSKLEVKFAAKDGGDPTVEMTRIRPGGMDAGVLQIGLDDLDEMTCSRPWKREVDAQSKRKINDNLGCEVALTIQELGTNKIPVGNPEVKSAFNGGAKGPVVDSTSSTESRLECVFGIDSDA
jgi:hypothetical protein